MSNYRLVVPLGPLQERFTLSEYQSVPQSPSVKQQIIKTKDMGHEPLLARNHTHSVANIKHSGILHLHCTAAIHCASMPYLPLFLLSMVTADINLSYKKSIRAAVAEL